MMRQLTLRQIERPVRIPKDGDLYWFCDSLGVDNGRDIDHIATRIILSLLENLPDTRGLAVEQIASDLDISSPRVNHHIRNLVETGLVYRHKQKIFIRGNSLRSMVQEIRKDTMRILDDLEEAATEIDESYGISTR
ncbi:MULTISPECIES: winged helix-turn-helix domain-containing protein [unclassified Methanoregula]|uniref:winged helix-turn-helix domain-containing protein n=1 Tax=unclassified Methanoregula TaxID=2649730 RepID=UPI0009D4597C|nr:MULTISPECIES: winged helix-turn-helix domain-containing protein [unclassified Methanoregula]OPX63209.1 MAG: Bacterial regulatory protein, arsR family [Methanoregula sp. PtaB.Bin085]OPY33509.1 MAG: Bacterial regulatory protein, arsR family [Methanoregula sp. PtaU1.Bin006]